MAPLNLCPECAQVLASLVPQFLGMSMPLMTCIGVIHGLGKGCGQFGEWTHMALAVEVDCLGGGSCEAEAANICKDMINRCKDAFPTVVSN